MTRIEADENNFIVDIKRTSAEITRMTFSHSLTEPDLEATLLVSTSIINNSRVGVHKVVVTIPASAGVKSLEELIILSSCAIFWTGSSFLISDFFYTEACFGHLKITTEIGGVTLSSNATTPTRMEATAIVRQRIPRTTFVRASTPEEIDNANIIETLTDFASATKESLKNKITAASDDEMIYDSLLKIHEGDFPDILNRTDFTVSYSSITYTRVMEAEARKIRAQKNKVAPIVKRFVPVPFPEDDTEYGVLGDAMDPLFGDFNMSGIKDNELDAAYKNFTRKAGAISPFFCPAKDTNCFTSCLMEHLKRRGGVSNFGLALVQREATNPRTSITKAHQLCFSLAVRLVFYRLIVPDGKSVVTFGGKTYQPSTVGAYLHRLQKEYGYASSNTVFNLVITSSSTPEADLHVRLFTSDDYLNHVKCKACDKWINIKNTTTHIGDCVRCNCGTAHLATGTHYISCKAKKRDQEGYLVYDTTPYHENNHKQNQYFADIESSTFAGKEHIAYCIVVRCITDKARVVKTFTGKQCMLSFLRYIFVSKLHGYMWFHNGSGFDFLFVLNNLLKEEPTLKYFERTKKIEVIQKGSKVLSFSLETAKTKKLTFRDTYMFMGGSLKKLGKDFGLPADSLKGDFDHSKIKTWEDVHNPTIETEYREYCKQDVLALEGIYKAFQSVLWDITKIPICKSMSLPGHGLEMWKRLLGQELVNKIHVPSKEVYEICRAAYVGGRVMATVSEYDLSAFDTAGLMMFDVVSLYPFVMRTNKFPVGKATISEANDWGWRSEYRRILELKEADGDLPIELDNQLWEVDIKCPKDIYLAFIMSRDEEGNSTQDLLDKKKIWVSTPEILEAVRIGYEVTQAYRRVTWPESAFIFNEYIDAMFELKNKNSGNKSSAGYTTGKMGMNAVSGKFGQKIVETKTTVSSKVTEDQLKSKATKDIDVVISKDNEIAGYIITTDEDKEPAHATQLSVFILSRARIHMSKLHRAIDGYRNKANTLLYTDTDSMVVHAHVAPLLQKYCGSNLGDLENEFPNSKIIRARFLAPKTYALTVLKDDIRHYKIRCKGIPHRGDLFKASESELTPPSFDEVTSALNGEVNLQTRYYVLERDGVEEMVTVKHLSTDIFDSILKGDIAISVMYGTLKKDISIKGIKQKYTVTPLWSNRGLCVTNWWKKEKCARIISPYSKDFSKTLPRGFDCLKFGPTQPYIDSEDENDSDPDEIATPPSRIRNDGIEFLQRVLVDTAPVTEEETEAEQLLIYNQQDNVEADGVLTQPLEHVEHVEYPDVMDLDGQEYGNIQLEQGDQSQDFTSPFFCDLTL